MALTSLSSGRCTEPLRLKGKKLKQIDPEYLCQESDPGPQGDQTDPSEPGEPSGIRSKPDATTSCHAYLFPEPRLDCSRRGLFTNVLFTTLCLFMVCIFTNTKDGFGKCLFRDSEVRQNISPRRNMVLLTHLTSKRKQFFLSWTDLKICHRGLADTSTLKFILHFPFPSEPGWY